MKIRSHTELVDFTSRDLAWRKKELTTIRFMLGRAREHERRVLLRAAVCILYAHWEGFVKAAAAAYVDFVSRQGLRHRDLAPNFVALALRGRLRQAGSARKARIYTDFIAYLVSDLIERAAISSDDTIDTNANLNLEVLRDVLCVVGVDETSYLTRGPMIDQQLLTTRNHIAHGERDAVEMDEYERLSSNVIALLEQFRTDIENAALSKGYMRS